MIALLLLVLIFILSPVVGLWLVGLGVSALIVWAIVSFLWMFFSRN
jgi:hypothetical protein